MGGRERRSHAVVKIHGDPLAFVLCARDAFFEGRARRPLRDALSDHAADPRERVAFARVRRMAAAEREAERPRAGPA
jgi:hypothetical protein